MIKNIPVAKSKIAKGKIWFYACIVALPILQFLIFYVGVNINSFVLAFQRWGNDANVYVWNGLSNFKDVLTGLVKNAQLTISMKNSIILFFVGLVFGTTLALLFSYYIYKK